ncbi:MAG: hypothetical protein FWE76_04635, partial [Symbiobacteriaceae bacterium]|nr:hypothetical protein [Symbiobacteriaceae bacterium]
YQLECNPAWFFSESHGNWLYRSTDDNPGYYQQVITRGGLTGRWKRSMKPVVTTNCEKSAEAIVAERYITLSEGLNLRR